MEDHVSINMIRLILVFFTILTGATLYSRERKGFLKPVSYRGFNLSPINQNKIVDLFLKGYFLLTKLMR